MISEVIGKLKTFTIAITFLILACMISLSITDSAVAIETQEIDEPDATISLPVIAIDPADEEDGEADSGVESDVAADLSGDAGSSGLEASETPVESEDEEAVGADSSDESDVVAGLSGADGNNGSEAGEIPVNAGSAFDGEAEFNKAFAAGSVSEADDSQQAITARLTVSVSSPDANVTTARADVKTATAKRVVSSAQTSTAINTGKGDLAPGKYFIVSAISSYQVIDVSGASKTNKANVISWRGSGNANQQWEITLDKEGYAILTSVNSGKVLDVEGARANSGANVIQWQGNGGKNQKWIIKKYGSAYLLISALNNNLVLDLTGNQASNGTNVEIWVRNNGKNQQFQFLPVTPIQAAPGTRVLADGVYTMKATQAKNTVVDVEGGSTANGANALTWLASGVAWQAWYFAYDNFGYYTISSVNSGRQLAPAAGFSLNGINVGQYSLGSSDLAKWKIVDAANGQYSLINKATGTVLSVGSVGKNGSANLQMGGGSQVFKLNAQKVVPTGATVIEIAANKSLVLDVYGNVTARSAKLGTYSQTGGLNQRFLVMPFGDGYTIRPFNSRLYLTSSSGVLVQDSARSGMKNQIWKPQISQGLVSFVNSDDGKVLSITGNAARASSTITLSTTSSISALKFYMRSVPAVSNGTYFIGLSSNQAKVIDVEGANRRNNANVDLWQKNDGNNQKFSFTALGGGLYRISNVATSRVLDVSGASKQVGSNVAMYSWNGGNNQKWRIEFNEDFSLRITSALTGYSLDTAGSSMANGANVIVTTVNGNSKTQRFWISDAVRCAEIVRLGVPCYSQYPELPTGCESVALVNTLRYWGYNVGKTTIADSYMPYGSDGVYSFIGNPYNSSGWIICAPGIKNTANSYLRSVGSSITARDITGTSLSGLRSYIDKGQPVIVWTTISMGEPGAVQWYANGYYPIRPNNHAVVVCGYDPFNGAYQVADSISGIVWRNGGRFEYLYNSMGKQAVVLEE